MTPRPVLLWISDMPTPANVRAATLGWSTTPLDPHQEIPPLVPHPHLTVVHPNGQSNDVEALSEMLRRVQSVPGLAVVLLPREAHAAWDVVRTFSRWCVPVPEDTPAEQLSAKLEAMCEVQPTIELLQTDLQTARRATQPAHEELASINEEMQLAAKLQQDFLPRSLPELPPVNFRAIFRPVSFVSGDIYDVARLDEKHVGFYIADAVGHGLPAALLTMFIKKALQTKRISGHSYEIVPPSVSMHELNSSICQQNLSSCQFCTAVYGVLNVETLDLTYARAGHPEPVLLSADGTVSALDADGCLLGVFPDAAFESRTVRLHRGDRLVVYSDGIEDAMFGRSDPGHETLAAALGSVTDRPAAEILKFLEDRIDTSVFGEARDDITVLTVEVAA